LLQQKINVAARLLSKREAILKTGVIICGHFEAINTSNKSFSAKTDLLKGEDHIQAIS
jgi:hypothetical protein